MIWDIAVIGGGAAGLAAALSAAETTKAAGKPLSILILERMDRIGKKLLATGNGRCNLSNATICVQHYHGDVKYASSLLEQYPSRFVTTAFERLGLLCRELDEGRIYPYNLQALAVLDILRLQLEQYGVTVNCNFPVDCVTKDGSGFHILSQKAVVNARRVLFATGGMASPQLGSDGSGYSVLKMLGHTITPLFPALVQLTTEPRRSKPLKGARSFATVSLLCHDKIVQQTSGEVQFTEYGLSGICVFELSRLAGQLLAQKKSLQLALDLAPEHLEPSLFQLLRSTVKSLPSLPCYELLGGTLNKLVGHEVMRHALPHAPHQISQLKNTDLTPICHTIKDFRFPVTGLMPWSSAQVTAGGIPLHEITMERMESKLCPGLFLAGELLNIDGDCGGYNLHWAWVSGFTAGKSAAENLLE